MRKVIKMTFYDDLASGNALKPGKKVVCKVPDPTGTTAEHGGYQYVQCLFKGDIAESSPGNELNLTGTTNPLGDAWLLPWQADHVVWGTLDNSAVKFLTYAVNGCGVLVSGTRQNPVVVHANASPGKVSAPVFGVRGKHPCIINEDVRAGERRNIYDGFVTYLHGRVTNFDRDNVATWYPGTDYSLGGVFGERSSGTWRIYGHAHGDKSNNSTTAVIWPLDAVATGENTNPCKCCYITTAVCDTLGLPDDCHELTTLRWFRDEVMERTQAGREEVAEYYKTAPKIVKAINERPDSDALYRRLYLTSIQPAVLAVRLGHMQAAHALYCEMVNSLNRRFEARVSELRAEEATDAETIARVKKMFS